MEVAAAWGKSSRSGSGNNCVEVAPQLGPDVVGVRDSKDAQGPVLRFPVADWRAFISRPPSP
ncbi:DUF397 domain-containing protein [Longispora fulva]|uniref:DUF397 domain-containing protein n=1 Tax=Longispora fulva TaxID=619741 RepID=UPI001F16D677